MDFILYGGVGVIAGLFAGLLGVGGGIVIVPILAYIFTKQSIQPELVQHLALGTSLAVIIFTSISSTYAHIGRKAVEWPVVLRITPGILIGGFIGSWLSAQLSTRMLKSLFIVYLFTVSGQMLLDIKPKTHKWPGNFSFLGVGMVIGSISSLVGIGGGTMSVPFMLRCNVTMYNAIGTSAAISFPIALAGAAGYAVNGLKSASLPDSCIGYICLPAFFAVALASIVTAPVGARLAHNLPVQRLNNIFAGLLIIIGVKLLVNLM